MGLRERLTNFFIKNYDNTEALARILLYKTITIKDNNKFSLNS